VGTQFDDSVTPGCGWLLHRHHSPIPRSEKAKSLLAEAATPRGSRWITYALWMDVDRQIAYVAGRLLAIGIDLKDSGNADEYLGGRPGILVGSSMMLGAVGMDYADATSQIWVMYYSGIFTPYGSIYFYYKNEKVDKLLEQARSGMDSTNETMHLGSWGNDLYRFTTRYGQF
jgi:ABC-type transport system substrate-binding protein